MKKPKKIRKYEADGFLFNTFKQLKNYIWYKTSKDTTKICYELEEDFYCNAQHEPGERRQLI